MSGNFNSSVVTVRVVFSALGSEALSTLRSTIDDAKRADPLSLVTVVVPASSTGLGTRRLLAAGQSVPGDERFVTAPSSKGLINTSFTTLQRWMEGLSGPSLVADGKRASSSTASHCAVRKALERHRGPLIGPVRNHPATIRAFVEDLQEMSGVPDAVLEDLRGKSERANEVVSVLLEARSLLSNWYTQADLESVATQMLVNSPQAIRRLTGSLVFYLPTLLSSQCERFIATYSDVGDVTVILGPTGDPELDRSQVLLGARLEEIDREDGGCTSDRVRAVGVREDGVIGRPLPGERFDKLTRKISRVISAPSPDVEVLACLRSVMERNRAGTPLERIAILFPAGDMYAPVLSDALSGASIPFNGRGLEPLSSTVPGRFILGLFNLRAEDWQRDEVGSWISGLPIAFRGRLIPGSDWSRLSLEAGISSGADQWIHQLTERSRNTHDAHDAGEFLAFMSDLFARFDSLLDSWSKWSKWGKDLLRDYLEASPSFGAWPDRETQALIEISNLLVDLELLEEIDPRPTLDEFHTLLISELSRPAPQITHFGSGVHVGTVEELVGLHFEVVFLLGMMDRCYPARAPEDPLLPDHERSEVDETVPLRAGRPADVLRALASVVSFSDEQVLSFSRGDFRQRSEYRPSRFVLAALERLGHYDRPLYCSDLGASSEIDGLEVIASFHAAVLGGGEPISSDDYDLVTVLAHSNDDKDVSNHVLVESDSGLIRSIRARRSRRSGSFTRFDGLVGPLPLPASSSQLTFSANGLQSYATCPRRYLFERVLDVKTPEYHDLELTINQRVRGELIHEVLFESLSLEMELGEDSFMRSGAEWSEEGIDRMKAVAEREFDRYEGRSLTGHRFYWAVEKERILRLLDGFVEADNEFRSELQAVPQLLEYNFGDSRSPVTFEGRRGTSVRLRGRVDRIDRCGNGSIVVADYKTGGSGSSINKDDIVNSGRSLQLPIYAVAAHKLWPSARIRAFYWNVGKGGEKNTHVSTLDGIVDIDENVLDRFSEVLDVVCEGINNGLFPANPGGNGSPNCTYCSFDPVCPISRVEEWENKSDSRVLKPYVELSSPSEAGPL